MDRRSFLAAASSTLAASVGGCMGASGDPRASGSATHTPSDDPASPTPARSPTPADPPPHSPTDTPSQSPTATPPVDGVVVEDLVVRKAVTYERLMGSGGVLVRENQQYVVATVRTSREVSRSGFRFETESNSWDPGVPGPAGGMNRSVAGHVGGPVGAGPGEGRAYLAFAVPSPLSPSNPRIRYAGDTEYEWPLSADVQDRLATPAPRFALQTLEVPSAVPRGEPLEVSLTVSNVADADGRFLGAVYWPTRRIADDDESHIVRTAVGAGEDATASLTLDTQFTAQPGKTVALVLRGYVSATRQVEIR